MKTKTKQSAILNVCAHVMSFFSPGKYIADVKNIPSYSLPAEAKAVTLWQTKAELGDGGHPFKWRHYNNHNYKIKYDQNENGIIFATFNCWRNSKNLKNRCRHVIKMLLLSPADIICLQETSPFLLRELISVSGIMNKFVFSDISGSKEAVSHKNGQLTLFRRHYIRIYSTFNLPVFDSILQFSSIAWARDRPHMQTHKALIIHVRFEPGIDKTDLFERLDLIIKNLEYQHRIIMLGDMNWQEEEDKEEEVPVQFGWTDVALTCGMETLTTSSGLDVDMSARPDRILYKQCGQSFKPLAYNIFGNEVIQNEKKRFNTFASTHLGVAAHFKHY